MGEEYLSVLAKDVTGGVRLPMGKLRRRDRVDAWMRRLGLVLAALPAGLLIAAGVIFK